MLKPLAPVETVIRLYALKRRIYLWALAGGILATFGGWAMRAFSGTFTPYERVVFPVMAAICLGLFISLWRTTQATFWVEFSMFTMTALSLLGRLVEILFSPEMVGESNRLAAFSDLLYWFPLVYILAFLTFANSRRLLAGSLVFFGTLILVGLTHAISIWRARGDMGDVYVLARFLVANFIYIILLVTSVRLSEQYLQVRVLTEALDQLAMTDPLLHIANRRELEAVLARDMSQAARHQQPLSLVMFDIDRFKQVNDVYGHEAGDSVLHETARAVQRLLRASDVLGRWGGDEFLVIAPHTDGAQAGRLAERLREQLSALSIPPVGGITGSFGVAEYQPPEPSAAWLKRADVALYAAKQSGRNQVARQP